MSVNIGSLDRALRLALGIVLILLGVWQRGGWLWAAAVGVVLVVTALVRICPAYTLLHIHTNKA